MKYIRLFEDVNEFQDAYYGEEYIEPWGSGVMEGEELQELKYNKTEEDKLYEIPLTFKILTGGTIYFKAASTNYTKTIDYRKNEGEWTTITSTTGTGVAIDVAQGDELQFRGNNSAYGQDGTFGCSDGTKFEVYGNINSLRMKEGFAYRSNCDFGPGVNSAFALFLKDCNGVISAENLLLPSRIATARCYYAMFQNCTNLEKAPKLPATEVYSECYNGMFTGCASLTEAPELPAENIASSCYKAMFSGCINLKTSPSKLSPSAMTSQCYQYMFYNCQSMETAPAFSARTNVNDACAYMFYQCSSVTDCSKIFIYDVHQHMFENCKSMIGGPVVSGTSIGEKAFGGCSNMTGLTLSTGITSISRWAFLDCEKMNIEINLPNLTTLGDGSVFQNTAIEHVTSLGSITTLPGNASNSQGIFAHCAHLKTVVLPDTLTTIGMSTFQNCYELESVTLPSSITSIGQFAFMNCSSLVIPDFNLPNLSSISSSIFNGSKAHVLKVSSLGNLTAIPDGNPSWPIGLFNNQTELTAVTLSELITSIGHVAFTDCAALPSITLPSSLTNIGRWAFWGCTSLVNVTCLATTPPTIYDANVFNGCTSLQHIYVPSSAVDAYKTSWSTYADKIYAIS